MAMLVTQVAAAGAALAWMFAEWATKGKPSVLGVISGAVAGLVAITPASGFVLPGRRC
jgi:Amt family ammonium transporter